MKVITFLGELIGKFHPAPDADHFGFITFHNKANLVFAFSNSDYHDKDTLITKIASEPIKLESETRTDLALIMARDELFSQAGGDRPDKPNVMIVLTDGKPTKPKGQKKFNFKTFAEEISKDFKVSILQRSFIWSFDLSWNSGRPVETNARGNHSLSLPISAETIHIPFSDIIYV